MTESSKLLKLGIKVSANTQRKFVTEHAIWPTLSYLYKFHFFELSEMDSCFLSVCILHIVNSRTRKVCKVETRLKY